MMAKKSIVVVAKKSTVMMAKKSTIIEWLSFIVCLSLS